MNPPYRPQLISGFLAPRPGGYTHHAVDIGAAFGALVVSTTNGRVLERWLYEGSWRDGAGNSHDGGWYLRMEDDQGFIHYYSHLYRPAEVGNGQRVWVNQVLGFVGNTGAPGACPHLHYQVRHPGGNGRGAGPYNPTNELQALLNNDGWRRFAEYSRAV
jgi:murein DD-endopeptidase MepM/ murein hydrolase activator NlpD